MELYALATQYVGRFFATCSGGSLLGFPTWYKYLDSQNVTQAINNSQTVTICQPLFRNINDTWLVLAAVIEILLRLGVLISVGFIIWGGIQIITSQGDPGGVKHGRDAIFNAVIGLIIAVMATVVVNFIAGSFH
jgi:hypothetical protein